MIEKLLGEQFSISMKMPAYGYLECSEIEVTLYNKESKDRKVTYKKTEGQVMNSSQKNNEIDFIVTKSDTHKLGKGIIVVEVKRDVIATPLQIIKLSVELLLILDSITI